MHPAPIKVNTTSALPHDAVYDRTLESGERIYRTTNGTIYALQPARLSPTSQPKARKQGA